MQKTKDVATEFLDHKRVAVTGVSRHPESHGSNVVFSRGAWARWKHVARHAPVLLIRGRVRKGQGAVSFDAERVEALGVGTSVPASRDFR